jgi:deoxyribodipyrimidine photo-lyase
MTKIAIAWLRNDLRVSDNPALSAAVRASDKVIALYIHEATDGIRPPGAAARWWLHQSLAALADDLAERGIALQVASGDTETCVLRAVSEHKAEAVFWNRRYAPGECKVDSAIKTALRGEGLTVESFAANVLVEPWDIATGQRKPYSVFTPFWNSLKQRDIASPLRRPDRSEPVAEHPADADYRQPAWAAKLHEHWTPGEAGAHKALDDFLDERLDDYPEGRDFPGRAATSRLSPHLRFGEISPRQIWHAAQAIVHAEHGRAAAPQKFLTELAWRDFNFHQLYHRPDISTQPMQPQYAGMHWRHSERDLEAWKRGRTGFPIVDAGMRELWATGYMENRVRMLVASLLAKNLLIDWRLGEQWFWDCLVDGDVANNPGNWQWVAGSGLDASPYFRIFNPVTQSERFDGDGDYVRRWVPELAALPDKWIQAPFMAPPEVLRAAGIKLGHDYPQPIVDLKTSRERALQAQKNL